MTKKRVGCQISLPVKGSTTQSNSETSLQAHVRYHPQTRRVVITGMEADNGCRCSINVLQIMSDLRNLHAVVELGAILDLVHRIYTQGQVILACPECRENPQPSFGPLCTLAEQCLSLFDAVCLAYGINRKNTFFDTNMMAFEQPLPHFICIRSKVQLGETEIDEEEASVLVQMLLTRNSLRLLELLEALQETLRCRLKGSGQALRGGSASLRACESSIGSIIQRTVIFIQQIEASNGGNER